ncbi:MAG: transketolase [Betaproteobacteria bacterium]|nr:transketolase [Betaproteobacteria bacterium]
MDTLHELGRLGQSFWIDNLSRDMIATGTLAQLVHDRDLRGVTSNPSIFEKALAGSNAYDDQIREAAQAGRSTADIYHALVTTDVRDACDVLRPVFEHTDGTDGFVSLEVSPHLARNAEVSIAEARRLAAAVDRPNLMIKIPGTRECLPAIEQLLFDGINVNVTLLFSVGRYEQVAEAWMRALERRASEGRDISRTASVASFFLSRIDVMVDSMLRQRIIPDESATGHPDPETLLGRAAIASAKLAYRNLRRLQRSERWKMLEARGARVQRLLWASTSTKDPAYSDVMYVEPLIGPATVNTMPERTVEAFADHGKARNVLHQGVRAATGTLRDLRVLGVDLRHVADQLEIEGVEKFIAPYDAMLSEIERKRLRYAEAGDMQPLRNVARKLRREVIRMTTAAGSGHPTSCLSCAEIVAALYFRHMRWDPGDSQARDVDTFVLSKGHAAPILWAVLHEAGAIGEDPMTLRRFGSSLEGHPTPSNPWVKVATGSLGQGLAAANGIALANRMDGIGARVYCLLGDGECSEGSVWESAQFASLNRLGGIVAIVDQNGLGQSGPAPYDHDSRVFAERFRAFGWRAIEVDGHDLAQVISALAQAVENEPTAIIARTVKGKGISFVEGKGGWHGKALNADECGRALAELGEPGPLPAVEARRAPRTAVPARVTDPGASVAPHYARDDEVATRDAFGTALETLGASDPDVVAIDGDVKNSTRTAGFGERFPERFFESHIAEQNMVGMALGLAACGKTPFATSFACFLSRAYDFVRMAGHSRPGHLVLCGSHAGVSIGEDGPSQMGLEDIAMFRAVNGSTVLYPSDAVSAERLTEQAARTDGVVYLRTTRSKTRVLYPNDEQFPVGGSKTLRSSDSDRVTIVAAGITVHEALAAHDALKEKGIPTRVIDAYSIKPLDVDSLRSSAMETGDVLVVEDHWIDGGLGDAVAAALGTDARVQRLAVREEPHSGARDVLLERYGISRNAIERAVGELAAA